MSFRCFAGSFFGSIKLALIRKLYVGLLILVAVSLSACSLKSSLFSTRSTVGFVLFDAGETKALEPVMELLREKGQRFVIIAVGTSYALLKNSAELIDWQRDCGVTVNPSSWSSHKRLPPALALELWRCRPIDFAVVGLASKFQDDLSRFFASQKIPVWAYDDSFSPKRSGQRASKQFLLYEEILVSSASVEKAIRARLRRAKVTTVGQPTLEVFRQTMNEFETEPLRKQLQLSSRPVALYAGGYGENYAESFRLFVEEANELSDYDFVVSLHPKVNGQLERRIIKKYAKKPMMLLPKSISTSEALTLADALITHRSSVAVQAAFSEKPVVYIDTKPHEYSDLLLERGWARQVSRAGGLRWTLKRAQAMQTRNIYQDLGVPKDSANLIASKIIERARRLK